MSRFGIDDQYYLPNSIFSNDLLTALRVDSYPWVFETHLVAVRARDKHEYRVVNNFRHVLTKTSSLGIPESLMASATSASFL